MFWISHINYEEADKSLLKLYDRVKGPENKIDNILMVHSLRPHTLLGHMNIYKNVLHHRNNTVPKWYLEVLGVYVSHINNCEYCVDHHFAGLQKLWNNEEKSEGFIRALKDNKLHEFLEKKWFKGISYAHMLTLSPVKLSKNDVEHLTTAGFTEGEVLEINQVVSYFNYANRTVLGLGVHTKGDILGLSPNDMDDAANWNHL